MGSSDAIGEHGRWKTVLAVSQKAIHKSYLLCSNSSPVYIPQKNESIWQYTQCSYQPKREDKNVHWLMNGLNLYPYSEVLFIHIKCQYMFQNKRTR